MTGKPADGLRTGARGLQAQVRIALCWLTEFVALILDRGDCCDVEF